MNERIVVDGVGLHSGAPAQVVLHRREGPVRLAGGGVAVSVEDLAVASSARATTVEGASGALRVGTVEHVFAALAGLGVRRGLTLEVTGPEMPLLDGGAARWCEAVSALALSSSPPRLGVTRAVTYDIGPSRYELTPGDGVDVTAVVDLGDDRFAPAATWRGDARDFVLRIAPARTFALARDVEELCRRGLARHVDPESVVVLGPDAVHCAGRPFTADEPARHKLLDLLGDLYLFGGPPLGRVVATRPGHASNARAFARALSEGVLTATRSSLTAATRPGVLE